MSANPVLGFVLFAFVAAITPGPSNLVLVSVGATVGVRRGLPTLCGVAIGMGCMIVLVALGLGGLLLQYPIALIILKWTGVGLILWFSWKIATATAGTGSEAPEIIGFWPAAALQWVNPKSWLVSAAATGAYLQTGASGTISQSLILGALFVLTALPACYVWLAFGTTLQRFLRSERTARQFNIAMGLLLATSIIPFI